MIYLDIEKESYREKILKAAERYLEKNPHLRFSNKNIEGAIVILKDIQVLSKLGNGKSIWHWFFSFTKGKFGEVYALIDWYSKLKHFVAILENGEDLL